MKWTNAADQLISQKHLTAKELAERLGITPHAVYQRRSKLGVKFWRNAKATKYPKSRWPRSYKWYRELVLNRDNWLCVYCGSPANEVYHVIPRNHGGFDLPSNLVASCSRCNNAKGSSCAECPKWKKP
jgi:5-methylcytosine-specific restriction endonuclease McrA